MPDRDDIVRLLERLRAALEEMPHPDAPTLEDVEAFAAGAMDATTRDALWHRIVADRAALEALGWAAHATAAPESEIMTPTGKRRDVARRAMELALERGALPPRRTVGSRRRGWIGVVGLAAAVVAVCLLLSGEPGPAWSVTFEIDPDRGSDPRPVTMVDFHVDISATTSCHALLLMARSDGRRIVVEDLFAGAIDGSGAAVRLHAEGGHYRFATTGPVGLFLVTREDGAFSADARAEALATLRARIGRTRFGAADCAGAAEALGRLGTFADWWLQAP